MYYDYLDSPIGRLLIVGDEQGLRHIDFEQGRYPTSIEPHWQHVSAPLQEACVQLQAYFSGQRQEFALTLNPRGTPFQRRVWEELCRIPYGITISYGELARRVGNANASRAVGAANGRNPLPIVVPCHRVIGNDGSMTGFGGGIATKRKLLALEFEFTPHASLLT